MTTSLHDRLAALADTAPSGAPGPDLWEAGMRRHRRRRAGATAVVAATVVLLTGLGVVLPPWGGGERPLPADVPFGELHLPRTVYPPSEWAPGTDEAGPPGPLAAVGRATRSRRVGLTGASRGGQPYGVSAVDGTVRFLDLPGSNLADLGYGSLTLSPDGTKVGYVCYRGDDIVGWAVYDTTTGKVVRLRDGHQASILGTDVFEISFSGDSRYLQTNYSPIGSDGSRDDQLVVWDVETGEAIPAERSGFFWLPDMGTGPDGIVWSRGRSIFRFDPATGQTTSVRVPQQVVEPSYGPDGEELAYVATGENDKSPWRFFAGGRQVDLGFEPDTVLGWRDADHVVVGHETPGELAVVDIRTGAVTRDRTAAPRAQMSPVYASGLWANEPVDGVRPPEVGDPRPSVRVIGAGVVVVVLAAGLLLWRRRRVRS
ncbi:WD40 repeat domain-containing protein [Nocardioides sp. T2.26MG-1]|uniref:WD40 repeat domain-containing protein n=1 Tax=Nocardioides sp. T2.26MG-1 TaxID=3041166 RepID=UPI002477C64F|nr:WD40 repeat domain-containing protein [Nocardioides sp. T2.26MG-1]CAI9413410.1 hypothetical protein HIDPHFAB_02013 [Nocardioides sp. T2.26MG-1]